MKTVVIMLLCLNMLLIVPLSTMAMACQQQGQVSVAPMTNSEILAMLQAKFTDDIIIAKIKSSICHFDTAPTVLRELKLAGVSDGVILAMIQAPYGMPKGAPSPPGTLSVATESSQTAVKIPDGTEIEVQLKNNLSGQEAKVGDLVDFTVLRPVQVNGVIVFDTGAPARGRVTTAKGSGRWGKAGKLEWAMQDVQAVDGTRVPARFTKRSVGDSSGGTVAVAAVATTVLLGPLGLLWGLKKGKAAIIPAGNRYSVFVQGDTSVRRSAEGILSPQTAMLGATSVVTPEGYNDAGRALYAQNKFAEAETAFREAVKLDPHNALYHHNLGTALNAQQKYVEAEKEVELAVGLAPNEQTYRKNLETIRTNRKRH